MILDRSAILSSIRKSPSAVAMGNLINRTTIAGGVTFDPDTGITKVRELSTKLGYNILDSTTVVLTSNSFAEGKLFNIDPGLAGSDLAFTRAGTAATITRKDGTIGAAAYNLLQFSEDFDNAYWQKTSSTITPNVVTSPIGTLTADLLIQDNGATQGFLRKFEVPTANVIGQFYTFYVYAKVKDFTSFRLRMLGSDIGSATPVYNTLTMTTDNPSRATITTDKNGFYLLTLSGIFDGSGGVNFITPYFYANPTAAIGDGIAGTYVWGAQLIQGSVLRPYLKTTTRLNIPRLDYSLDLTKPSLLIEPNRTNLIIQSENLNDAVWTKSTTSILDNTVINQFGTNKGQYVVENTTSATHIVFQQNSTEPATTYTASWYVKKADATWCQFVLGNVLFGNSVWRNFNFDTGLFGNGSGTWSVKALVNGYYLISVVATTITAVTTTDATMAIYGTNNTNSATRALVYVGTTNFRYVNVNGMQFEAGSNISSYIPTTTTTILRSAETSFVDMSINGLFNQNNFTLYCEGTIIFGSTAFFSVGIGDTTNLFGTDSLSWYNGVTPVMRVANVQTSFATNLSNGSTYKFIIQRSGTTVKFFRNGAQIWTTQTVPVFNYRYLAINNGGSSFTVNIIALFNKTLSDAECVTLTS